MVLGDCEVLLGDFEVVLGGFGDFGWWNLGGIARDRGKDGKNPKENCLEIYL